MKKLTCNVTYLSENINGKEEVSIQFETIIGECQEDCLVGLLKTFYVPMYIKSLARAKTVNRLKPLTKIISIEDIEMEETKETLNVLGKDIFEMSFPGLMNVVSTFQLIHTEKDSIHSLEKFRKAVAYAYLKDFLKIPMKTGEEQERLPFYQENEYGKTVLNFKGCPVTVEKMPNWVKIHQGKEEIKKISMDELLGKQEAEEVAEADSCINSSVELTEEALGLVD